METGWPISWKWYYLDEENPAENISLEDHSSLMLSWDEGLSLTTAGHSPKRSDLLQPYLAPLPIPSARVAMIAVGEFSWSCKEEKETYHLLASCSYVQIPKPGLPGHPTSSTRTHTTSLHGSSLPVKQVSEHAMYFLLRCLWSCPSLKA